MRTQKNPIALKRSLGLFALVIYGVGDIMGAGIYALVGKIAGLVGPASWISFAVAFFAAGLTALTYAEFSSRYPRAAGASLYALRAFQKPILSYLIGFVVMISGVASMATVSHAIAGYIQAIFPNVPTGLVIVLFFLVLTVINFWGIEESSMTNQICTAIEISGIILVIVAGLSFFGSVDYFTIVPAQGLTPMRALLEGGVLAFYAFIGFEDIANVAEEVKNPEKTMPRAILIALGIISVIYILTALACVSALSVSELSQTKVPLMAVVNKAFPQIPLGLFTLIALFAVSNTALVNFIMGSRILYGMSEEGLIPAFFGKVHPRRRTPHIAIAVVLVIALSVSLTGQIVVLAQSTSLMVLSVFLFLHLGLIVVKLRTREEIAPPFEISLLVPALGVISCGTLVYYVRPEAYKTVLILVSIGMILYFVQKVMQKK